METNSISSFFVNYTWAGNDGINTDHRSIPPRVFGPSQYLMMPTVQLTKPKSTLKPKLTLKLLPTNSTSKLVPPNIQSDAKECQHVQLAAGADTRRVVGADVAPINNFVQWF